MIDYRYTLAGGKPGGVHWESGAASPSLARTSAYSSWYTAWVSLGHLQDWQVFLEIQKKYFIKKAI